LDLGPKCPNFGSRNFQELTVLDVAVVRHVFSCPLYLVLLLRASYFMTSSLC